MKILVAMSGGVDSSSAALLLAQEGHTVAGGTMRLHTACRGTDDAADAQAVCDRLGIPFHLFDLTERFRREVIDRFAQGYARGITPNPCVDCNRTIKFGAFLERSFFLLPVNSNLPCPAINTTDKTATKKSPHQKIQRLHQKIIPYLNPQVPLWAQMLIFYAI